MISVSCLKVVGSYSYICLSSVIVRCCDFSFINYALCQAFPVSWAVLALSQSFSSSLLSLSELSVLVCSFRMILLCLSKKDFMLSVQL